MFVTFKRVAKFTVLSIYMGLGALAGGHVCITIYEKLTGERF